MRRKPPRQPALDAESPPAPLPTDPQIRAEILSGIAKGLAEARAGLGVDVDEMLARWDRMLAAPLH